MEPVAGGRQGGAMIDPSIPPETPYNGQVAAKHNGQVAAKRRTGVAVRQSKVSRAVLPSGRSVAVQAGSQGEFLEVCAPGGEMELRIDFTPEGPVVRLHCARLELAAGDVAMSCRSFDLRTTEDVRLNGRNILLNCALPEETL